MRHVLLLLALLAPACTSTTPFHEFVSAAHERDQFNGTYLVMEGGVVLDQGAFGRRDREGDALTLDSVFRLASVSKQFTAMAILILREQGKLTLDQDLREFVPELPYEGITVRHLVHHTSGLPDYTWLMHQHYRPELEGKDERLIAGNEVVLTVLAEHRPEVRFAPGERWEYSNTGYMLLATIVARASGQSFPSFLAQHVFEPAGMTSTSVYSWRSGPDPDLPRRAFGHREDLDGQLVSTDENFLNGAMGDGGVYSTLADLARWDRILYTDELVPRAVIEEAFTPGSLAGGEATGYGFGWFVDESPSGGKVVAHSGGWAGFLTYIHREIEEDRLVILLTNSSRTFGDFDGVLEGLIGLLHGEDPEPPVFTLADHLGRVAVQAGAERTRAEADHIVAERLDEFWVNERAINLMGYELLGRGLTAEAVVLFQVNLERFPESANCYDSLADGLVAAGDRDGALENYRKALALDPSLQNTQAKLAELEGSSQR